MRGYSIDLRERIVRALDDGMTKSEAARTFKVSRATVQRYDRHRDHALAINPARSGPTARIGPEQRVALERQLAAAPGATLAEHCALWEASHRVRVSVATMSRAFARFGLRRGTPRAERGGGRP
jgi:transposase